MLLVPISLMVFLFSSKYCCAVENITRSQNLSREKTLISPGQIFELGFFSPTNNSGSNLYVGIWYKGISPQTVVWVLNREAPLSVAADISASLKIDEHGNLELLDGKNSSVWSTNHSVSSNIAVATLLDNGNLVLKEVGSEKILWQSFDHLGDTLLPSSVLRQNDLLNSWKSETDPSVGDFNNGVSTKLMPAQSFTWKGTSPYWRSGPWDGSKFIGIPNMDESYQSPFTLVEDAEQRTAYLYFNPYNVSVSTKFFLSPEGDLKFMLKEKDRDWSMLWESRQSQCDVYGFCGNFGVCKASESPICRCLKGYVPRSDPEWREQNWTQGCFRRAEFLCEKNNSRGKSDVFHELSNAKLPDFYEYFSLPRDTDSCRALCLGNCSCKAYAHVKGIGCFIWPESIVDVQVFSSGGEDLFLRLAHGELGGGTNREKIIISLATISSVAITLSVFLVICFRKRRANRKKNSIFVKTSDKLRSNLEFTDQNYKADFPIFDYESILIATDHFGINNKLGQGGFGPVYKGKLLDGTEIAVKRLASSSGQGPREFKNEMVLVSKLQHRNLVRLLGCCTENDEKLIVYEYMPNKSLDNFIFDSRRSAELDWTTRFNIIIGIARGLVYLHRDSFLRVIHRDLKASNILLDEKMNPKISDFGLAKIFEETLDLANTNRVVGTLGYMAPEYAMGGIFSEKSDVFSFGILILEIVSGRKNTSFKLDEQDQHMSLIGYAWQLWNEGMWLEMMDKALGNSYSSAEAMRCVHVGLLCIQDQAADRPAMPGIVSMLINETDIPSQPKEPLFTFQRPHKVSQQNDTKCSANDATVSLLEGR